MTKHSGNKKTKQKANKKMKPNDEILSTLEQWQQAEDAASEQNMAPSDVAAYSDICHPDALYEGREGDFMDVDRMVNEGLGGGEVTIDNGLIGATTTDTMEEADSIIRDEDT